ncbi:unnamed protein product [Lactuca virosa]|uniref:Uncharacterized protein n=1 Tax=Lactuca virosa TaxID=75947 RepID=A0AAU9N8R2_9ASTR|nr:unnamed protein product [Lactuca virosa]
MEVITLATVHSGKEVREDPTVQKPPLCSLQPEKEASCYMLPKAQNKLFLPQDRFCEFAKLSPMKLLKETEKVVGDPQLPVLHRAFVETSAKVQRSEQVVEKNKEILNQLKALNAEHQQDVERVRQRDELLAKEFSHNYKEFHHTKKTFQAVCEYTEFMHLPWKFTQDETMKRASIIDNQRRKPY